MDKDLLTVQELALRLRVKVSWVYTHADNLGAYRLGKYIRFSWERVLEHLQQCRHPSGTNSPDLRDAFKDLRM